MNNSSVSQQRHTLRTGDPFDGPAIWSSQCVGNNRRGFLRSAAAAMAGVSGALLAGCAAAQDSENNSEDFNAEPDWVKRSDLAVSDGEMPFVHIYTGANGRTIVDQKPLILPSAGASLLERPAENVALRVLPPNMSFDYHRPSQPRLVAVLRGVAQMGLRDGTTAIVNAGTILLVENMTGDGHTGQFGLDGNYVVTFDAALPMP